MSQNVLDLVMSGKTLENKRQWLYAAKELIRRMADWQSEYSLTLEEKVAKKMISRALVLGEGWIRLFSNSLPLGFTAEDDPTWNELDEDHTLLGVNAEYLCEKLQLPSDFESMLSHHLEDAGLEPATEAEER